MTDQKFIDDLITNGPQKCPTCGKKAVIWKKTIISGSAASLVKLVNMFEGQPIHLDHFIVDRSNRGNGNFSQLHLWDLIQPGLHTDTRKRSQGTWSPTEKGKEFAFGRIEVPKYVFTYNNVPFKYEGPMINIREALGQSYDHAKLLDMNYGGR